MNKGIEIFLGKFLSDQLLVPKDDCVFQDVSNMMQTFLFSLRSRHNVYRAQADESSRKANQVYAEVRERARYAQFEMRNVVKGALTSKIQTKNYQGSRATLHFPGTI